MPFRTDDIVSGGTITSGAWMTISGTYIQIMRQLNSESIPEHKVKAIIFDAGSAAYVAFIHTGRRET